MTPINLVFIMITHEWLLWTTVLKSIHQWCLSSALPLYFYTMLVFIFDIVLSGAYPRNARFEGKPKAQLAHFPAYKLFALAAGDRCPKDAAQRGD